MRPIFVTEQIPCSDDQFDLLKLEYVYFDAPVPDDILSPCYPQSYYKPVQVNRKIWFVDVADAVGKLPIWLYQHIIQVSCMVMMGA